MESKKSERFKQWMKLWETMCTNYNSDFTNIYPSLAHEIQTIKKSLLSRSMYVSRVLDRQILNG